MGAPQDRIHADRIQSAIATGGAARSALVASWRRSAELHGLDPTEPGSVRTLSENEFRIAFERMDRLVNIAQASMDRLYMAVGGVGCCVLLADNNGVPVERRGLRATTRPSIAGACGREPSGARRAKAPMASAPALWSSAR